MDSKTASCDKLVCPKCSSKDIRTNRNGESWCRRCGASFTRKEKP